MTEFKFNYIKEDYNKRFNNSLLLNLVVSTILGIIVALNDWRFGIGIGLIVFVIQNIKSNNANKFFINHISITENEVSIEYFEKNEKSSVNGLKSEFEFRKKLRFNKTRTAYLVIYQNGQAKIEQYNLGEWTESKMDEVIKCMQ